MTLREIGEGQKVDQKEIEALGKEITDSINSHSLEDLRLLAKGLFCILLMQGPAQILSDLVSLKAQPDMIREGYVEAVAKACEFVKLNMMPTLTDEEFNLLVDDHKKEIKKYRQKKRRGLN